MITINRDLCIGCGQCVADCFPEALKLEDGKAVLLGNCIECGHCYAVCPQHAIDMGADYPEQDVIEYADWEPEFDSDTLMVALKSRRSIRRFKAETLSQEEIAQVLEAGRFTPTGSNAQNVRYIVVQEALAELKHQVWQGFDVIIEGYEARWGKGGRLHDTLMRMKTHHTADAADDRLFFNAPALIIVASPHALNAGLAASSIALAAHVQGLGTLYSGFIQMALSQNPGLCERLGVKPEEIQACLLIGKPAVTYQRTAPRKLVQIDWR